MRYSILFPNGKVPEYKILTEVTFHDLGLDSIIAGVGRNSAEQDMIRRTMCAMTADEAVAEYRCDVFNDILKNPELRTRILKLLDKVNFIKDYGVRRDYDEKAGIWDLMHRLDEVNDYIACVEDIHACLSDYDLESEGLINLRKYVDVLYNEAGFGALKKDIESLNATTSDIRSVTLGVNLNERFEADAIGVVSINNKPFTRSNIIKNFCDRVTGESGIHNGNDWNNDYGFRVMNPNESVGGVTIEQLARMKTVFANPVLALGMGMGHVSEGDISGDITRYMDKIVNHMLDNVVGKLREVLARHVMITIKDMTDLIPEFVYYVRWAEYIEKLQKKGWQFSKAKPICTEPSDISDRTITAKTFRGMKAMGVYNLKLADAGTHTPAETVPNNIDFSAEHRVYILTGANRGGKTTITQTIGQLYVMAQGGIFVPGAVFEFTPIDCVYTHFPADEDKTMDLGRLGEECRRFKELYSACTESSLLLLNESFSTTSFEEGYYIACDAVKAILSKGITTIYNTHMHKIAYNIDELNKAAKTDDRATSLVVESVDGVCTYRVHVAPPEGMSYARSIAKKYGVTYEELIGASQSSEE